MRPVPLLLMLAFLSPSTAGATHGTGNDDSTQAGDVASCNASFQEDCLAADPDAVSSSSVAAPIGDWANSTLETLVLLAMIAGALRLKTRRGTLGAPHALGSRPP
jgi:hypothetical protein